ncbi:ubiquitin-conjugating enzyme E2 Z-like [Rhipicephalus sanguineus]|uniref:ubiquitin-conjugating enzyme E2 Z-like n=1 Tax=Rhipicephalus sanguineus TaxID=34632 RepID=UPI001895BD4B|nr:ubiquitin-conjugating enzyme E2 Z-like [Rhipicephalus sanguineus]
MWDPLNYLDVEPTAASLHRVSRDMMDYVRNPVPRSILYVEETDFTRQHVLLVGEQGTAWASGFFEFFIKFPRDYPTRPPRVRFLTTDHGRVQFHEKLPPYGMVRLDVLATTGTSAWRSYMTLSTTIHTIKSLLRECRSRPRYIRTQTMRVAVLEQLKRALNADNTQPPTFRKYIIHSFLDSYDEYERSVTSTIKGVPFATGDGWNYKKEELLAHLRACKEKAELFVQAEAANEEV